ncbi:MAG: hypothetical protein KR126chlam3_00210 [Chlamydiae bacterium]|nr:hypothetical protein [Chlamydiota bacterium]
MASGTNPSADRAPGSGGDFFSPARIAERSEEIRDVVDKGAPVVNAVVKTVVTAALSAVPDPVAQLSAPVVGVISGQSAESASRIASETLVIPGMEAAERGSGMLKDKIDKQC